MHHVGGNQKNTNGLDGIVGKRYKERLKFQKHESAIDTGSENEEEFLQRVIKISCDISFHVF